MKLFLLLILALTASLCQAQYSPSWAFQISDRGKATISDVEADSSGNILICGVIALDAYEDVPHPTRPDSLSFGNTLRTVPESQCESFVAKFRQNGELVWSKFIQGEIIFERLAIDPQGNVYVGGHFTDTLEFDDVLLEEICVADVFLARADSNGYFQWGRVFGATWHENVSDVACDKNGAAYITAIFRDSLTCPIGTLYTKAKGVDFFIAKLSSFGDVEWINDMNTDNSASCSALDIDAASNIVLAGSLEGKLYIMRLTPAGSVFSFYEFGNSTMRMQDVVAHTNSTFTVLLEVLDSATIGTVTIPPIGAGNTISVIANIRSNGSVRYVTAPTLGNEQVVMKGSSLSYRNGKLAAIGQIAGSTTLGNRNIGSTFSKPDSASVWACILDAAGSVEWAHTFAINNTSTILQSAHNDRRIQQSHDVLLNDNGDLITAGRFRKPFDEGSIHIGPLTSLARFTSNDNAFVLKFERSASQVATNITEKHAGVRMSVTGRMLGFELINSNAYEIAVFDILGRRCAAAAVSPSYTSAEVACPASGTYLVHISHDGKSTSQTVIVR